MADENEVIVPTPEPAVNPAQERIQELSGKVKTEAEARQAAEERAIAAERKAAFAEGYADVVATNPAAKEFKSDIEAKVSTGMSVEDATFAVLGKAGKLGMPASPAPASPAGGSASTTISQTGTKTVAEMTQAERREALEKELISN